MKNNFKFMWYNLNLFGSHYGKIVTEILMEIFLFVDMNLINNFQSGL